MRDSLKSGKWLRKTPYVSLNPHRHKCTHVHTYSFTHTCAQAHSLLKRKKKKHTPLHKGEHRVLTLPAAPLLRLDEGSSGRTRRPKHGNGGSSHSQSLPRWAPWSSQVLRQCYLWEEVSMSLWVPLVKWLDSGTQVWRKTQSRSYLGELA